MNRRLIIFLLFVFPLSLRALESNSFYYISHDQKVELCIFVSKSANILPPSPESFIPYQDPDFPWNYLYKTYVKIEKDGHVISCIAHKNCREGTDHFQNRCPKMAGELLALFRSQTISCENNARIRFENGRLVMKNNVQKIGRLYHQGQCNLGDYQE